MAKIYKQKRVRLDDISKVIPVIQGGLGTTSKASMKAALNYISKSSVDAANGVAGLDSLGKLKSGQQPTILAAQLSSIDGPSTIPGNGASTVFNIVNYSDHFTYIVASDNGTVTRTNGAISVTPASAGTLTLTLRVTSLSNNIDSTVLFKINVVANGTVVDKPVIAMPRPSLLNLKEHVTLSSSNFTTVPVSADTHLSSTWIIATDSSFSPSTIVSQVTGSTTSLRTYSYSNLLPDTVYYARVQYRGTSYGYSPWSDTIIFVTDGLYGISYEQGVLMPNASIMNAEFSKSMAGDYSTEDREYVLVVGSPGEDTGKGSVYVYTPVRTPNGNLDMLRQAAKLNVAGIAVNSNFGTSVAVSGDARCVVVGAKNASSGKGAVYVYRSYGSTDYVLEDTLTATDGLSGDLYGYSVSISRDGTKLIVGAPNATRGGLSETGAIYIYNRVNGAWIESLNTVSEIAKAGAHFGTCVVLDDSGTYAYAGAVDYNNKGAVYIYRYTDDWAYASNIVDNTILSGSKFGSSISVVGTYSLAIGAPEANAGKGQVLLCRNTSVGSSLVKWTTHARIFNDKEGKSKFGTSVAISPDLKTVTVGAPSASVMDDNGTYIEAGAVHIYEITDTGAEYKTKLVSSNRAADDNFGHALVVDMNNSTLHVGAPNKANLIITNAGTIYTYR